MWGSSGGCAGAGGAGTPLGLGVGAGVTPGFRSRTRFTLGSGWAPFWLRRWGRVAAGGATSDSFGLVGDGARGKEKRRSLCSDVIVDMAGWGRRASFRRGFRRGAGPSGRGGSGGAWG